MRRDETTAGLSAGAPARPAFPTPLWLKRLAMDLPVRSQFAVSGNIRDLYPVEGPAGPRFLPAADAIWATLSRRGFGGLLVHDPVEGMRLHPGAPRDVAGALAAAGIELGGRGRDLDGLARNLLRIAGMAAPPVAV
ncbi:MAG: hypothetical protein RQ752_15840, partial [Thermohalobaculum sp.]|nr:hypothetical protein [Thermohalobaculum sp.]